MIFIFAFSLLAARRYNCKMRQGSLQARDVLKKLRLPEKDISLAVLIVKAILNFVSSNARELSMDHIPTMQRIQCGDDWRVVDAHPDDRKVRGSVNHICLPLTHPSSLQCKLRTLLFYPVVAGWLCTLI